MKQSIQHKFRQIASFMPEVIAWLTNANYTPVSAGMSTQLTSRLIGIRHPIDLFHPS